MRTMEKMMNMQESKKQLALGPEHCRVIKWLGVGKGPSVEGTGWSGLGARRGYMGSIEPGERVDILKINFSVGVNMYRLNVTSY